MVSETPIYNKFEKMFKKAAVGRGFPVTQGLLDEGAKQCERTVDEFVKDLGAHIQDNKERGLWLIKG